MVEEAQEKKLRSSSSTCRRELLGKVLNVRPRVIENCKNESSCRLNGKGRRRKEGRRNE